MSFDPLTAPLDAKAEKRANVEDPTVKVSASNFLEFFGQGGGDGAIVNIDSALGVPAFFAGVNFLSGTLAGLPLSIYERTDEGRKKVKGAVADMLHDAVNDETTSFMWRKNGFDQVFTGGRFYSFVERDAANEPINLWPLPFNATTPKRVNGRKVYDYREGGRTITYEAKDIIDVPMMLKADGVRHYSPVMLNKDVIGLAIAITRYGKKFFNNGGVPPFAIEGPLKTAQGVGKASTDMTKAVKDAANRGDLAIALPDGHKLTPIGADPEKMQMVEAQRFIIEQIARILSLPPVFLQDLTHGTFTNSEQQDLHLAKHTVKRWCEQLEQELNLKLFGRKNPKNRYVRFNLDGLMRGDFKTRLEGLAIAVQNALMRPNEGRALLELEDDIDGNLLMIQGGTVPVKNQKNIQPPKDKAA